MGFFGDIFILSNVLSFYLCVTCLKQCYVEINFIIQFYLFIIYWTIVDCAFIICARQNKESEKGLLNTNKQKTNTRTYVNQRDDMLTKTKN